MLSSAQLKAVANRYPEAVEPSGRRGELVDLEVDSCYQPLNLRDAIGWIASGESDNDGENPRTSRLARWWHLQPKHGIFG